MAEVFLSDAWWRLAEEPASEDSSGGSAVVNLRVERGPEGEKRAYFTGRRLVSGHSGAAVATVTLPFTVAHAVFVEGKLQDAMSAYAVGRIRVEGSMAGLGAIAGTDDVGPLRERLRGITAPLGDGPSLTGAAARQQQATADEVERLGLGDYARELDTQGYAIVPREVTGMDVGFIDRLYGRVLDLMEEESGVRPDVETGETHRDVYYPSLYYCLFKDRMFETLLMNEYALAMGSYLVGDDSVLSIDAVFMKGPARPKDNGSRLQLGLHADYSGWSLPYPHPAQPASVNCTWLLTDYAAANGALVFVPGSHQLRRSPVGLEGEDRMIPVQAPRGTLVVWERRHLAWQPAGEATGTARRPCARADAPVAHAPAAARRGRDRTDAGAQRSAFRRAVGPELYRRVPVGGPAGADDAPRRGGRETGAGSRRRLTQCTRPCRMRHFNSA